MKKYYLMAIDLGYANAMYGLGTYYRNTEEDFDIMKKYYLMAINIGYVNAMYSFGVYYQNVEKDYDSMKKYYLMAVDLKDTGAMYNLAAYYAEKDYDLMKKYYLMAIKLNDQKSFDGLKLYYQSNNFHSKLLKLAIKYQNLTTRENIITILNTSGLKNKTPKEEKVFLTIILDFEFNNNDNVDSPIKLLALVVKKQITLMRSHFEYALDGPGFSEAKHNFVNRCDNY
jgi:hypothetical protein